MSGTPLILSPHVLSAILGGPGAGKSTLLPWIKRQAQKTVWKDENGVKHTGIPVWSNYPLAGARILDMEKLLETDTRNSILLIDEAGLVYNSRDFKTFNKNTYNFFATARHRHTQIFILVQAWDRFDLALRELTNWVFLVKKSIFPHTTVIQRYSATLDLVKDQDGNAKEFTSIFKKRFTSWYFKPLDYGAIDTFYDDLSLTIKNFKFWEGLKVRPSRYKQL
jgi:hypothetical protein